MRKKGPRQLSFVFADSPSGGGKDERSDASELRSFLLHKAKRKKTSGPNASGVADTSRLLEDAATEANLARALLNVVRNKGRREWMDRRSKRQRRKPRLSSPACAVICWRDATDPAMFAASGCQSQGAGKEG